jgi:FkbM family methyltransferase
MPHLLHTLLRSVCHRFPLLTGRGTLLQQPPLNWMRFPEQRLAVPLPDGRPLVVFPNDFVGKSVYFFGDLDPKIARTLNLLLEPGDTFVDIGANVGLVCLQCLARVGPAGRVVAVEPQPACCAALAETVRLNGVTNLEIHPLALSEQAGRLMLHLPDPDNRGTASLEAEGAGAGKSGDMEVEVRHAGEFLASLRLGGEYAVKIDVEGHEGAVLAGLVPYFAKHPPRGVVFESHGHLYRGEDFFASRPYQILGGADFRIFQIRKSLFSLAYGEVDPEGPAPEATDLVAVRPDAVERLPRRPRMKGGRKSGRRPLPRKG